MGPRHFLSFSFLGFPLEQILKQQSSTLENGPNEACRANIYAARIRSYSAYSEKYTNNALRDLICEKFALLLVKRVCFFKLHPLT